MSRERDDTDEVYRLMQVKGHIVKRPQQSANPTTGLPPNTTMTRHHFKMIANMINALDLSQTGPATSMATQDLRLHIAYDFARALEDTNAHFDRKKFIDACTRNDREKLTKRASTGGEIKDFHPDDTLPDLF